jgi:NAD(P)-dependent dehydrogenase (short-subunit alcohol dehydrogenase family)
MRPNTSLEGKVALIMGAASGIGLALAELAAKEGMKVVVADGDRDRLPVALKRVKGRGGWAIAAHVDVSDLAEVGKLARRIEVELGPPWLICNTAERSVVLNVLAVTHGVHVFAPSLAERGEGHIVNVVTADSLGGTCPTTYAAAMHAIVGLSESLYRELDLMGSHVGVTLACPAPSHVYFRMLSSCQSFLPHPVRSGVRKILPPDALAERIFAAISARQFRVATDAPEMCGLFDAAVTIGCCHSPVQQGNDA